MSANEFERSANQKRQDQKKIIEFFMLKERPGSDGKNFYAPAFPGLVFTREMIECLDFDQFVLFAIQKAYNAGYNARAGGQYNKWGTLQGQERRVGRHYEY